MSTSNSSPQNSLRIKVAEAYRSLVKVSLSDARNRIISPIELTYDGYLFQVKTGLYNVRIEMNANVSDQIITVIEDDEYLISDAMYGSNVKIIEPPLQYSSALLQGENAKRYNSSHEYYTYPAIEFSQRDTFTFDHENSSETKSSLFIFMRFPSIEKFNLLKSNWLIPFYMDFKIVDEKGNLILNFENKFGIEVNEVDGWLAFNAMLPNGIYYLVYNGVEPRQIPIYVYKNWHTQFFMTLGDNEPLFGSTRIFISERREFAPLAETNKYIDVLLDKLQNGDFTVDKKIIEIAADGKFQSPMLGLICCYVYLKSAQTDSDDLFKLIVQNMKNIILKDNDESPDLRAIEILEANHFGNSNFQKTVINGTPMFRVGFEAIKNASLKNRELISKNSANDFVSETMYYDSPFNTFKPISMYESPIETIDPELENNISPLERKITIKRNSVTGFASGTRRKKTKTIKTKVDKYSVSIQQLLRPSVIQFITNSDEFNPSENSWVKNSIAEMLKKDENISIDDISTELNLSGNTILRIFDTWKKELIERKL